MHVDVVFRFKTVVNSHEYVGKIAVLSSFANSASSPPSRQIKTMADKDEGNIALSVQVLFRELQGI